MTHACNSSSTGGHREEDHSPRPALGENAKPYLKNNLKMQKGLEVWLKL
jgi:hypothetical protein